MSPVRQYVKKVGTNRQTSRERRPKSALYLRLKKRNVFKIVKGGTLWAFETPLCEKKWKNEGRALWRHKKMLGKTKN